ncbi:putative oxidoreductase [Caenibius tardaugens NBRC 16725]|uniref:Putative oxidoreductase n=1 Tax=Caenibius tardaugens NBRC 16725 TaxID=1219035 RepID=U2YHT9_9SPHN|nr:glucose 1-dehydrogenase [Caenibius tardaugens]AZI37015.1 glucose 1-dehydrogenase [Caenibius tardaugens NBRC 16725]GAD47760.1 putative oxidoreductase [Caenibius tardaugens NBRC 16725]
MSQRFAGKVAVVTGGARGMGEATARRFAAEGAKVIIGDVLEAEGKAVAESSNGTIEFVKLDVTNEDDWAALVAGAVAKHGRIDALVNNAAVTHFSLLEDLQAADIDRVLSINVKGTLLGLKHVGKVMLDAGRGAIVNISSVDGFRGANTLALYSSTKWAVRGLTKTAALEFGPRGVRVNSVHPGGVDTVMGNPQGHAGDDRNWAFGRVPLQRIAEPEEIAAASVFLCSDDASYCAGAELAVDGGWAAGYYHAYLPGAPTAIAEGQ